jgi:hypothetical protein
MTPAIRVLLFLAPGFFGAFNDSAHAAAPASWPAIIHAPG